MTPQQAKKKSTHLNYFRERAAETLATLQREIGARNYKDLASAINKASAETARHVTSTIESAAQRGNWSASDKLESVLAATYASYVVMLEFRNQVWPYEYMAFSRRIGELWESFVRTAFDSAPSGLSYFVPPLFSDVRTTLRQELTQYIAALPISEAQKAELLRYYEKVWLLVDSGEINLELDLHFSFGAQRFNVDLKSGFGSNEKGNTNRLLMVATIYKNLEVPYENFLLVRAAEDRNNHYFRTLRDSGVWTALCGTDAYAQMAYFTGFDLGSWVAANIDWSADLDPHTYDHFQKNDLIGYLEW
jgi:hypothetical protein